MATGTQGEFVAVVNDTDPKSNGKAYSLKISGNNYSQILGKKIGDVVDGIFVGEGDKPYPATSCRLLVEPTRQELL